ncbi:hypothetical protein Taro_001230 [Colocasia esculenta]|uniref:Uncharacterized protein n=1 Tax=Colocasia esculenta TaxID=4460 RepID=A0A843TAD6_COLES|nr:hypothetical protein [Colocasia esculenta]
MLVKQLHGFCLTAGTQDPSLWSRLVRGYLSQGLPWDALLLYARQLPQRTREPTLPLVLKACATLSLLSLGKSLHAESIKAGTDSDVRVGTTFISVYWKCGHLDDARAVFDGMRQRNVVTHNAMISGYCDSGDVESALLIFDRVTSRTPVTWALMVEGFAKVGNIVAARKLFDRIPWEMRTVVTWTAMVHGYTINGQMEAAKQVFDEMPSRNFFVWSSMISGYFREGKINEARLMFDQMPSRNLVNWNTLIAGYAQNSLPDKALEAFRSMQESGLEPDEVTVASALSACAQAGSLDCGIKIHELIKRNRIKQNQFVSNGLVDMYAKCGDIGSAKMVFEGIIQRNVECWNSMISGFASHGNSGDALELFARMEESEQKPNNLTFLVVLSACTHGGFVKEGLDLFTKMEEDYGLRAGIEHYGCLIDLLGRAGKLDEAYDLIKRMPMQPNDVLWGALLGACRIHARTELAEGVVEELGNNGMRSETRDDARFVLLSNIYASSDRWVEAENMRRRMVENGVPKIPGCSLVMGD